MGAALSRSTPCGRTHRMALQWGPGIPPEVTGNFCPPQGLESLSLPPSTGSDKLVPVCACVSVSVSAWTCPLGPGQCCEAPRVFPVRPEREGAHTFTHHTCTLTHAHTHAYQTHDPPSCSPLIQTTHMSHMHLGTHRRNTHAHTHTLTPGWLIGAHSLPRRWFPDSHRSCRPR